MKIAIDLTPLYGRKHTGLENYGIELYHALLKTDALVFPIFRIDNTIDNNHNAIIIKSSNRLLVENIILSKTLRAMDIDVALFPIFPPPIDIYINAKFKVVPTIHDLAFLKFPNTLSKNARLYLTPKYKLALRYSFKILSVSQTVQREINQISDVPVENWGENISKDYENIGEIINVSLISKYHLHSFEYFLSVSTIEPRKNLVYLLKIFKEYRKSHQSIKLILVGRNGWGKNVELVHLLDELGDSIVFTDFVSTNELVNLYYYSKAFFLLSHYEGFGRTPLEALACGSKVFVSDIPVFNETLGENAVYLPLNDVSASLKIVDEFDFNNYIMPNVRFPFNDLDLNVSQRLYLDLN